MDQLPLVTEDGKILLGGSEIDVPNVVLDCRIGDGANGVVFKGRHKYLQRDVAVKIWLKLREKDKRDKFRQGVFEARKAADAGSSDVAAKIYEAGDIGGIFYTTMEYFEGITVRDWLEKSDAAFLTRCQLAFSIAWESSKLVKKGIVHGDLHTKNILIRDREYRFVDPIEYKIVDFGTSHFSAQTSNSLHRHWRILDETVNGIIHPFNISRLLPMPDIDSTSVDDLSWRYVRFFRNLGYYLQLIGASFSNFSVEISATELDESPIAIEPYVVDELKKIRESGTIELSQKNLGDAFLWDRLAFDLKF